MEAQLTKARGGRKGKKGEEEEERGCIWSTRGEANFAVEEKALALTDTLCRRVVALYVRSRDDESLGAKCPLQS